MQREMFICSLKKDLIGSHFPDERSVLNWKDIHVSARFKGKQHSNALENIGLWLIYIQPVVLVGDEPTIESQWFLNSEKISIVEKYIKKEANARSWVYLGQDQTESDCSPLFVVRTKTTSSRQL